MNDCIFNDRVFCPKTDVIFNEDGNDDNEGQWAHWNCINWESLPGPVMTEEQWSTIDKASYPWDDDFKENSDEPSQD